MTTGNDNKDLRMYSVNELAELTGRSVATIYAWIYQKKLPTKKVGSRVYIMQSSFEKWLDQMNIKEQAFEMPHYKSRKISPELTRGLIKYSSK